MHEQAVTFRQEYPRRHLDRYGPLRPVVTEVIAKFLDCGDLHQGFARVRCPDCRLEYLLAFSCTTRGFCPSCQQRRPSKPPMF
ncbi:MAG: transposase zinc-binding domain-containing protein [Kiritimatiellae bacterium]|nr:transposase zinc-binding domain-containing protein [Kiritimatiellia bacterium]